MWLRGNAWKFLRQIWQDCLAGLCSLMCWFCLKLLHVYEIGITPNFKFRFCIYTSLYLLRDVTFRAVIAKFTEKVETELCKVDTETYSYAWTVTESATKLKTGNCRWKQREQLRTLNAPQTNNGKRDSMHASAVRAVFSLPLPVLSFVTDHAHQYIYVSILWSSTCSFFRSKFENSVRFSA